MDIRPAPGRLDPGRRIYAIGDIHGCLDRLAALHDLIAGDLRARPVADPLLVHLGDYVDRGPESAGVVARLADGPPIPGLPTINLMGNHENTMLAALAGERAAATDWLYNGGGPALQSWGIDPESPLAGWAERIPARHRAFLERLPLWHRADTRPGGYLFVHAGLRPGIPLSGQERMDCLGIRASFLVSDSDFGMIVVHGHTPKPEPVIRPNRIGVDTGAVYGGKLTCAVLERETVGFLQV